ncbi:MAG: NADH-quinone oxidoreductase subunit N [Dehalococcoidia bacterium]
MDYSLLVPEFVLAALAFLIVGLELTMPRLRKEVIAYLAAGAALITLIISLFYSNVDKSFGGLLQVDNYTTFFRVLFLGIAAVVCVASAQFVRRNIGSTGEYYGLLLISTIGSIYMAAGTELITSYISFELLSFSLYILVSFQKRNPKSNEGGMKFMLLGAFSSALFLYGLSLLYGITGTTHYNEIASALANRPSGLNFALLASLVLIVTGLGFKVAAVPFHMWTPDAYEGAPLPITAFLSVASKGAGFAFFLRLFSSALLPVLVDWRWMIALLAALTMTVGNLVAIQQHNIKRLLAYSSIGQVGFLLLGIASMSAGAASALLFHLAGYVVTNLAAFLVVITVFNLTGKDEIADFSGLAERAPFLALALTIALFSLAGMPLFAGFFTKFLLFQAGVQQGLLWLVVFALVNSFISLYYYLQVIKVMYLGTPEQTTRFQVPGLMNAVIGALILGVFFIGIYPRPLLEAASNATRLLFS